MTMKSIEILTGAVLLVGLMVCSSDILAEEKVCRTSSLAELTRDCQKGDIILITPNQIPIVCDFSKEIIVSRSTQKSRFGIEVPAYCVYQGTRAVR